MASVVVPTIEEKAAAVVVAAGRRGIVWSLVVPATRCEWLILVLTMSCLARAWRRGSSSPLLPAHCPTDTLLSPNRPDSPHSPHRMPGGVDTRTRPTQVISKLVVLGAPLVLREAVNGLSGKEPRTLPVLGTLGPVHLVLVRQLAALP